MGDYADDAFDRDISFPDSFDPLPVIRVRAGDKCPKYDCDGHYVDRHNKKTGNHFLGCSNFPKCRNTR